MKKTVWKVEITPGATVELPAGFQILTVQTQNNVPCLWAIVDADKSQKEVVHLNIYGTGHLMPDEPGRYVGTFQIDDGMFVFHVFEPERNQQL